MGPPRPNPRQGGAQTSEFDGRDQGGDDGDFETASSPDQLLAWNQLALDLATAARRGPTISCRLYSLVNTALYDSWAMFDEDAKGSIYNRPSGDDLEDLLEQAGDLDEGSGLQSLRDAVMAVAANNVIRAVGATLFPGGTLPQTFLDRSVALLDQQLAALSPGTPEAVALRTIAQKLGGAGVCGHQQLCPAGWLESAEQLCRHHRLCGHSKPLRPHQPQGHTRHHLAAAHPARRQRPAPADTALWGSDPLRFGG